MNMMNDPYSVLGVSRGATDEEIKTAYRALARKYHPDNYANNPLADLANEKMKEINEAYDQITQERRAGAGSAGNASGGSYGSGSYSGGSGSYSGSGRYAEVRTMINNGRVDEAQSVLDGVPVSDRDAEWHFLMGSVLYRRGWINEAYVNFQNAYRMQPGNQEYREAVERISRQMNGGGFGPFNGGGFGGYNGGQPGECNGCDLCTGLLCTNCMCQLCGGGGGC